jgi:hypothetical protein
MSCLHVPWKVNLMRDTAECDCGAVVVSAAEAFNDRSDYWTKATLAFARAALRQKQSKEST